MEEVLPKMRPLSYDLVFPCMFKRRIHGNYKYVKILNTDLKCKTKHFKLYRDEKCDKIGHSMSYVYNESVGKRVKVIEDYPIKGFVALFNGKYYDVSEQLLKFYNDED